MENLRSEGKKLNPILFSLRIETRRRSCDTPHLAAFSLGQCVHAHALAFSIGEWVCMYVCMYVCLHSFVYECMRPCVL